MVDISTTLLAVLAASTPVQAQEPVDTQALSAETLIEGNAEKAIPALENRVQGEPEDPALLINLGIAHAQSGATEAARALFERALVSPEPVELELADGRAMDSRRLARKAIRMLDRGEFTTEISRRD